MTITRLVTLTAETQTVNDLIYFSVSNPPTVQSTKAHTGTYSYRSVSLGEAFGRAIGSRSTVRVGYWINHLGAHASGKPNLFIFGTGNNPDENAMIRIEWDSVSNSLNVLRATAQNTWETLATVSVPASLTATDTWIHLGCTYYSHDTLGFLTLYVNGTSVLTVTGDTRLSYWNGLSGGSSQQLFSTSFDRFYMGGRKTTLDFGWAGFTYFDDIYVDSYDSEIDVPVPARRFLTRIANGAGVDTAWTPLASTNVSQIDDGAPNGGANDGDTTYNHTDTLNLRDTFTKASVTIPAGYRIVGMVLFAHTKTLDVGPEISLHLHDGSTYADGDDLVPPFDYTIEVSHRFSAQPDASLFNETDVNNLSIGYRSRGVYS